MKGWRLGLAGSLVGAVTYVAAPVCVVQADTSGWLTDVGIAELDATPADVETAGLAAIAAAALGTAAYGVSQVDWQSVYNDTSSFAQDAWAWAKSNVDAYGGLLSSWGAGTSSAAISLSGSLLSGLQNWLQSEWSKVDSSTAVQFGQTIAASNTSKVYTFANGDTYCICQAKNPPHVHRKIPHLKLGIMQGFAFQATPSSLSCETNFRSC